MTSTPAPSTWSPTTTGTPEQRQGYRVSVGSRSNWVETIDPPGWCSRP
jgi:hypothetical protein